jgi:hypothetical protein
MKTVHKLQLLAIDVQHISLPAGAEILCAHEQYQQICIWYRCDPTNITESRKIAIVGTGHPAPEDGRYIGTVFLRDGSIVFHVFAWPN